MILYIFPEAGLVLFMSLYQWVGIAKITILDVYILFTSQRSTWSPFTAVTAMLVTLCETFSTWIFFAEQSHLWGGRALTLAGQSALQCEILMLVIGDDEMATCSSKATSSIFYLLFSVFFIFTNFQLTGLVCVHSLWTVWREEKSLFRSLHQLGIVSWMIMIMIMVRDAFYWWSRRWWRWCTAMAMLGNWEADKAQLACCGSFKRKLPWPEPRRIEKEASTNRNENPGI